MSNSGSVFKKLLFGFALWLVLVSGFFYLHENKYITEETIKTELAEQIAKVYSPMPSSPVLGIYNSVTLTPTPEPTNTQIVASSQIGKSQKPQTFKPPVVTLNKKEIYDLINIYRETKGLAPVSVDTRLEISAYNKAKDMVAKNYFDHGNPWVFITNSGYKFNYAAENLAVNYFSSSSLFNGWKTSPSHNAAMLDSRNEDMGLSFICNVTITNYQNTCVTVIHFAREQD